MPLFVTRQPFNLVTKAETIPQADTFPTPVILIVVASLCLLLTTLATGVRVVAKIPERKRFQVDDFAIIVAEFGFVAFVAIFFSSAMAGPGTSISNISASSVRRIRLFANILSVVYAPTILAAKIAIFVQTARFFATVRRRVMYWTACSLVAMSTIAYMAIFFIRIFACTPRAKISDPAVVGSCVTLTTDSVTVGAINIMTNAAVFVMICCIATKLQLTRGKKILVVSVLCVSLISCACSIFELVFGLKMNKSLDFPKAIFQSNLWALSEIACILLIACCQILPRDARLIAHNILEKDSFVHAAWISNASSRSATPASGSGVVEHQTSDANPIFAAPVLAPDRAPEPNARRLTSMLDTLQAVPEHRPFSIFEPVEQRKSYLSHDTWNTGAAYEPASPANSRNEPGSPISIVSLARKEFSIEQVRDAWEMRVTPVALGNITKTIDVRVSAHTNPGTPITWCRPDPLW